MNFDTAFDLLLGHEGGYSRHPSDPGGETMWGVTRKVAMQEGYTGDMHVMPREFAKEVYRKRYWDAVRADELPDALRFPVFDSAVNSGVKQAIVWLQRALDIGEDGILGPLTMKTAQNCDAKDAAVKLYADRLDFLTSLPTWAQFGRGWSRRIASNLRWLA